MSRVRACDGGGESQTSNAIHQIVFPEHIAGALISVQTLHQAAKHTDVMTPQHASQVRSSGGTIEPYWKCDTSCT
jgi:hypothetical protein